MKDMQDNSLFTELTPEESATVNGAHRYYYTSYYYGRPCNYGYNRVSYYYPRYYSYDKDYYNRSVTVSVSY